MKEKNSYDVVVPKKEYKVRFRLFVIFSFIFVVCFSLVFVIALGVIEFLKFSKLRNGIIVPDGMELFDLDIFTFRNNTLYKYNSNIVILKHENGKLDTIVDETNEEDSVVVVTTTPHAENLFDVECEGSCECYEDTEVQRRHLASIVFRKEYVGVVAVSVLGFAASKFVHDNLGKCYNSARELLGREAPITCIVKDIKCNEEKAKVDIHRVFVDSTLFECNGHCVNRKVSVEFNCEDQVAGKQIIEINPKVGMDLGYYSAAVQMYRIRVLEPFCAQFSEKWDCLDTPIFFGQQNIKCKRYEEDQIVS